MSTLAAKLLALHELHVRGLLTDAEFAAAKEREIQRTRAVPARSPQQSAPTPAGPPPPAQPRTLNPVIPAVGLALGAAAIANGGLGG